MSALLRKPQVCYVRESVISISKRFGYSSREVFQGGALDIGAQKSVIGLQQAHAYCQSIGIDLRLSPSNATVALLGDNL